MTIKSENNISRDDIKALINCNSARLKFMLILLTVTFLAFLIFCFIMDSMEKNFSYCFLGIIWCAVVYIYAFVLKPKFMYKSFNKRYTANAVVKYEFNDTTALLIIENEKGRTEKYKKYCDMFRIYETPEYYFFYTKRNESYIMKKSGITEGSAQELSAIIEKENPRAFIRKAK
ncbi:MAG: YcxB family protein [Oscillospiraceae bacterium]|nr:YcxB family protein [Oscillospiraceae bacterium]